MTPSFQRFKSRDLVLPIEHMRLVKLIFLQVQKRFDLTSTAFTRNIFSKICKEESIDVIRMELEMPGYYVTKRTGGEKYIFLKKGLSTKEFLRVAGHELGHHFLDHTNMAQSFSFGYGTFAKSRAEQTPERRIAEVEADYFSVLLNAQGGQNEY